MRGDDEFRRDALASMAAFWSRSLADLNEAAFPATARS